MKIKKRLVAILLTMTTLTAGSAATDIPLILGGELSNSATTSVADIDEVMPRMRAAGLNTVLTPVYWELMEPVERRFDFTLVDRIVEQARANQLKVVLLWFGAWKNSMSCYAPAWVKTDTRRFPRAMTRRGKPLEIVSAFSDELLQADRRAFCALVAHLKATDAKERTVVMIQVENEIGMLEDARDHSPLAEEAYARPVPEVLLRALGRRQGGTWSEVFGTDAYADEQFQAWHYARYVQQIAAAAHELYDIPLYVNAALNSRGRKPGEYPSAGPLAHLATIWKCAAPDIALLAPDIYDTGFKDWVAQYALPGNPLFIPETRCSINAGARALFTFGEYRAVGFSPFAIDQAPAAEVEQVRRAYGLVAQLHPYLAPRYPAWGLLLSHDESERVIHEEGLRLRCGQYLTLPWDPRASDGSVWREGGAVIVRIAPREYLVAGSGIVVEFRTDSEQRQAVAQRLGEDGFAEQGSERAPQPTSIFKGKRAGLLSVDEVSIGTDGTLGYIRRDNGDQSHQGRHVRISVDDYRILHVKVYEY